MGSRVLDVQAERSQSTSTYTKIYKDFFAKQFLRSGLSKANIPFYANSQKKQPLKTNLNRITFFPFLVSKTLHYPQKKKKKIKSQELIEVIYPT